MRQVPRLLTMAVSLTVAMLLLAGCDHFAADPVAFTVADETPIARLCLPVEVTSIKVSTFADDEDVVPDVAWSATGHADLEGGSEFQLGTAPAGMTVMDAGSVDYLEGGFAVDISATDEYGSHHFSAYIEPGDLQEGVWLSSYGPVQSPCILDPCPLGYSCMNRWPQPTGSATSTEPNRSW